MNEWLLIAIEMGRIIVRFQISIMVEQMGRKVFVFGEHRRVLVQHGLALCPRQETAAKIFGHFQPLSRVHVATIRHSPQAIEERLQPHPKAHSSEQI